MNKSNQYLLAAVPLIVFAYLAIDHLMPQKPQAEQNLAQSTQAAFIKLDARIIKCTQAVFQFNYEDDSKPYAPLFENMGNYEYPVTTSSKQAQVFFNQGLKLTYAFNHAEAHRSFMEAARLDPKCAMAYWGAAYALGPNINDPIPDTERKTNAYQAVQKAMELSKDVSKKEEDLIIALSTRYGADAAYDIDTHNTKYMEAMTKVVKKYPKDADIQTLYTAAIMNTMPWNYWDSGHPNPGTLEGKKALETAISINPDHPGAHHYYIHLVELPQPDLAVPSADKLGSLIPAAGHLVHMPAHIYFRVGRYEDAAKANVQAIAADEDYISQCLSQGMYPLSYYPHNIHFLWSAASFLGDSKTAIASAKKTAEKVPVSQLMSLPFLQDFYTTPMLSYVRFGKWNEILTIPNPGIDYQHVKLIWHYARGIAFVHKNNLEKAREELVELDKLEEDLSLESLVANYTNPSSKIALVAQKVLGGEIAAAVGNYQKAIGLLEKGVQYEDLLIYSEPAAWHVPVRHTLGAVLLKANMPEKAEAVYRKDLENIRDNGWSLMGLHQSLKAQDKTIEAEEALQRFKKAWAKADIQISGSVL